LARRTSFSPDSFSLLKKPSPKTAGAQAVNHFAQAFNQFELVHLPKQKARLLGLAFN